MVPFAKIDVPEVDASLRRVVHHDLPFGPPDTQLIDDPRAAAKLFDWHNYAFANLLKGSHIIIGRRGAGKSALVRSYHAVRHLDIQTNSADGRTFLKEYDVSPSLLQQRPDIIVDVDTFEEIFEFELQFSAKGVIPPPEVMTPAWERRIWFLVATAIRKQRPDVLPPHIRKFLDGIVDQDEEGVDFRTNANEIINIISNHNLKCVVIFDSGEEYSHDALQTRVFEGLCRATSNLIARRQGIDVRLCMPAEIIEELEPHFSNPGKDFFRKQYLHWTGEELFRIAAHRLQTYLRLYDPVTYKQVASVSLLDRAELWGFWRRFLPQTVTNDLGGTEDTIVYILRHTHLLPRQLIQILNEIWGQGSSFQFNTPVTEKKIKEGVQRAEVVNKNAILSMYRTMFKDIYRLFDECMPLLSRHLSYGDLHSVFNESGARKLMVGPLCPEPDFWHFRKLLFSSGTLGVVDTKTSVYLEARFQFNQLHPLTINEESRLCVHPMFSRTYELKRATEMLAVLPRGSDFQTDGRAI